MDRKEAEKFFNTQRHNCSDVELSRGAVYYPVSFITEVLETYKREGVIEQLQDILTNLNNGCSVEFLKEIILSRISELKNNLFTIL